MEETQEHKTARDLRSQFLRDSEKIVDYVLRKAGGTVEQDCEIYRMGDSAAINQVWAVAEQLIKTADDAVSIDIKTTRDIITAATKGKITVAEAHELMALFRQEAEVMAIEQGDSLGEVANTVNIIVKDAKGEVKVTKGGKDGSNT